MSEETKLAERVAKLEGELGLANQMLIMKYQQGRFESDLESEKGTHQRASQSTNNILEKFDNRLRVVERSVWIGTGMIMIAQIAIAYFINK